MKQHCRANENLYDLKGEAEKWRLAIFGRKTLRFLWGEEGEGGKSYDFNPNVIRRLCIVIPPS